MATGTASRTGTSRAKATKAANEANRAAHDVADTATSQGRRVAGRASRQTREVASDAAERGGALVESARQDTRQLAGTVRERAAEVTGELTDHTRSLAEEARDQVTTQVRTAAERAAVTLGEFGEQAQALADGRPEDAPTLAEYVERVADGCYGASDRLYRLSEEIETDGLSGVLNDLQGYARRRPGTFLLGAVALGFGVGRMVRAQRAETSGDETAAEGSHEDASGNGRGRSQRAPRAGGRQ